MARWGLVLCVSAVIASLEAEQVTVGVGDEELLEHHVGAALDDVREAFLRPVVQHLETTESAPELDARGNRLDEQLGDERGVLVHPTILGQCRAG
ncbi:hypothetical protein EV652_106373 [Kribbella steppae]|uniref:Uncharacterized protein n=1 Tax=Kribbella steppae TaxID=2512223 RepID=A0A4R2HHF6_9ACTN|nr:hypothetical protein EV652_106373 [Kribbella steppae]